MERLLLIATAAGRRSLNQDQPFSMIVLRVESSRKSGGQNVSFLILSESWMGFRKMGVGSGLGMDVRKAVAGCQGMRARRLVVRPHERS